MVVKAEVLIEVPKVLRVRVQGQKHVIETCATLEIVHLAEKGTIILRHDSLVYALDKNLPIFSNTRPDDYNLGKRYILPNKQDQTALIFTESISPKKKKDTDSILNGNFC